MTMVHLQHRLLPMLLSLTPPGLLAQQASFNTAVPSDLLHTYATHGVLSSITYRGKPIAKGSKIITMGVLEDRNYDEVGDYLDLEGIAMIGQLYGAVRCYMPRSEFRKLQSTTYVYESVIPGHSQPQVAVEGTVMGLDGNWNLVITGAVIVPWNSALMPPPPPRPAEIAPPKPSVSKKTVSGQLIYLPRDKLQAQLLYNNGNLVLAFVDSTTWKTLNTRITEGPCVTLSGNFDDETQGYVVRESRAKGEKRDILAIRDAHFVSWTKCRGDEVGTSPPSPKPKITPLSAPRPECKPYSPEMVTLNGHMESKTFAGPPNYTDVAKGDTPEVTWVLYLKAPLCTNGTRVSNEYWQPSSKEWKSVVDEYGAVDGVVAVQLLFPVGKAAEDFKHLLNSDVAVDGRLFPALTGHHHTQVMLQVSDIKEHQ